jgi:ABC-2 type transport system permease protein
LGTIGLPLFAVGVLAVSVGLMTRHTDHTLRISFLDNLGGLGPQIAAGLEGKLPNGKPQYEIVRVWNLPPSEEQARQQLNEEIRAGRLDGFLEVPKDILEGKTAAFHTSTPGDFQTTEVLSRAVDNAVVERHLSDRGIHLDNVSKLVRGVGISMVKVTQTGESEEKGQTFAVGIGVVMILYITLVVYGVATMRSVVEEKTTRIVEILASSVKPFYLLSGKILGVAAVGTTQYLVWGLSGTLLTVYGASMASALAPGASMPNLHLPTSLLVYALLFFLVSYLLYASLYAALGAMVSSDEELQQVQLPVTLVLVVSFLVYPVVMRDPNSATSVILSLIPFCAPVLMVLRIALQTPPFWQIALSLLLSLLTTAGIVQVSAKIYRVGILMYGKRPSLVELLRWLRYT